MVGFDDFLKKAQSFADCNDDGKIDQKDWEEATKDLDEETKAKVAAAKDAIDSDDNGKIDLGDLQKGLNDLKDRLLK